MEIGQVAGPFGLKGHVKVTPNTHFLDRFQKGRLLRLAGIERKVLSFEVYKGRPLILLEGVRDATAAEGLQKAIVEGRSDVEITLDEDEFFVDELVGLQVVAADGEALGEVDEVENFPAQDVLVVGDILIPLVKQFVKSVDLEAGTITVELIPGMRGEDEALPTPKKKRRGRNRA